MDDPTPGERLDAALQRLRESATAAAGTMTAQGAFGWMMRGDLAKARATLVKLSPDKLTEVSAAAAALSALADEVAAEARRS
ncbi:hypothetical protein NDR87_26510 [Nocardia sp. CDC159]|uniref:Uncharacterized protein n=1 Tax=Nocardia pulmonis TaxID=2951408 RepID=A0A9X2IZK1_9NOCA|nr:MULTISPECIES: hypothetical protein [Nocardia]MCM6775001.1 hypothetical protein [Nocardia pulmonis]MCM6789932.1 hypothetical protein [Nocardia sp. CDC159]